MMNSISTSPASIRAAQYGSPITARVSVPKTSIFEAAMMPSPAATHLSIPSMAKVQVAPGAVPAEFDMKYNNIDHTQAEYNAHYAEGARQISASQGLPYGQYDFTKVSAKQLNIISNDMIVNQGKTPDDISGFMTPMINGTSAATGKMSEEPMNIISIMTGQKEFEASVGNSVMADFLQGTLDLVTATHSPSAGSQDFDIAKLTDVLKRAAGANIRRF